MFTVHCTVVKKANLELQVANSGAIYEFWCFACLILKMLAAIFLIKQLNTYLPEQMQTHFPFCFFCFSVMFFFFFFFNPKSICCLFSISFTVYSQCCEYSTVVKYPMPFERGRYLKLLIALRVC